MFLSDGPMPYTEDLTPPPADVRSISATNGQAPSPRPAGQALVLTLPKVPTRSLDAYRIDGGDPA